MKKPVANIRNYIGILSLAVFLYGCSASEKSYYEIPLEFRSPQKKSEFIQNYYPYIRGRKIFIDPGHGGKEKGNKGFESFESEANLNLKVSLYLKNFLSEAGAVVFMSRTKDTTIDLKHRSILADSSGAEIFISIHHNAPGSAEDIWTDYTSTYYHAHKNDFEYEPCNRDIAKYVQRDLAYAVRNSGGPGSFDGTYSDYNIYPGQGFSVLRETKIPAILVECAFSTDHFEAGRLSEDEFNQIESWGIFRGLCRYFKAGIPQITFLNNSDTVSADSAEFSFLLNDSTGIDTTSIKVQLDSTDVNGIFFNDTTNILSVSLSASAPGEHWLRVIAANKNGNHSFPFRKEIYILPNE